MYKEYHAVIVFKYELNIDIDKSFKLLFIGYQTTMCGDQYILFGLQGRMTWLVSMNIFMNEWYHEMCQLYITLNEYMQYE